MKNNGFFLGYSDISNEAYNVQALSRHLDMANIYAYDYHGYWDQVTGHHSAIDQSQGTYYAKYAMDYYTKNGFAKRPAKFRNPLLWTKLYS